MAKVSAIGLRKDQVKNWWKWFIPPNLKTNIIRATTWDFQQCGMCDQQSRRSACAYTQSDQSLCLSLEYTTSVKLLTEHHLEFLSLKGGYTGSSESTLVKMPHCWKSHVTAHLYYLENLCLLLSDHYDNGTYFISWSIFLSVYHWYFMDPTLQKRIQGST